MKAPIKTAKGIPEAFLQRMSELLGNEYADFLTSLQLSATTGLRVNTLKISPNDFQKRSSFNLSPVAWCSSGYIVESQKGEGSLSPGKHPFHNAGLYYLQEPSAMAAAEILAPQPGEKVLDLAAAPGGKATHLAALMQNTGLLIANEIHPKRVWDLVENLERCGVTNAIVINESPQNLADHFGEFFDRVLIDAPCSGEGMFRKSEPARKEWKPELVGNCAIRQNSILEQAARMVKPGGHLAYTTCSFSAEENEGVIATFLAQHPEYDLDTIQPVPGYQPAKPEWVGFTAVHRINRAIRIWPHLAQGEGHFIALLIKHQSTEKYQLADLNRSAINSNRFLMSISKDQARSILNNFCRDNLNYSFENSRLVIDGSYIYHLPEDSPNPGSLKVIHPGWWLGSIRKQHFTPSHSLAMGIYNDQAINILPLHVGDHRLSSYFAGECFPDSGDNGWVLITVDGFPIGWGKRVQNIVKNFYPHGLRRGA
jgi:NOL1/NOP2/sun family putative RNA methylase